ncbi:MAG: sugar phosphate isomerase/epimerase [Actinobacteria bacterium]|nr:sugar phosphate isomerase/epimerase [Actinomycetota bacterium]
MKKIRYACGTAVFSNCPDRFIPVGYHDRIGIDEVLNRMSKIELLSGVELGWPGDFIKGGPQKTRHLVQSYDLEIAAIEIDTSTNPKFMLGTLTNPDEKTRREFLEYMKRGVEEIEATGCQMINLWLGQEGFDYPFQVNYQDNWKNLIGLIAELAAHRPNVKFCLEYKIKEPRTHCHLSSVGKTLLIARETGVNNVGVNIDTGHAMVAYENIAESAAILGMFDKLFHVHINDNYGYWDDDMVVGSVHFWETLEFFYWLDVIGYEGWLSLDLFPYRESWEGACIQSIKNMEMFSQIVSRIDKKELKEFQSKNDAISILELLRKELIR